MKKQLKFERCSCVATYQPTHRQRTMMNKQKNAKNRKKLATAIKNNNNRFDSSDIKLSQSNHKSRIIKGIHAFSKNRESIDTMQKSSKKIMSNVYKK